MRSHRLHIRGIVRVLSVLYAAWLAWAPPAARASCAEMSLTASQANADIIVLGQVTQTTGQDARFAVDIYTKGRGPHEFNITGRVSPDPGMHTSVDFTFQQGQRYLLFLKGSPPGLLRTNALLHHIKQFVPLVNTVQYTT